MIHDVRYAFRNLGQSIPKKEGTRNASAVDLRSFLSLITRLPGYNKVEAGHMSLLSVCSTDLLGLAGRARITEDQSCSAIPPT